jgi:hypothetical protein
MKVSVVEAGVSELQAALGDGRVTSRELVLAYLARIATYEDRLNAVLAVDRDALRQADALDRERATGRVRGPLHGIPIALKDNIHVDGMPTTGGALAFDGLVPPYEATLARNLRASGAIILAKTGMTELANWVAGAPSPMPGSYSALAGFGMNPYDPRRDPREATRDGRPALGTGGSSSGIGTAVSFWAASVGCKDADCSVVFKYGMKRDFNAWLASLGERAPLRTLRALRHFNLDHQRAGAIKYGQSLLDVSDEMDVEADRARYVADRARDIELAGRHGIDEVMKAHALDALLFPGSGGAAIAARPGYPTVIVPFGFVKNAPTPAFPDGFDAKPAPFGVSFTGLACSEPRLLALAHALEHATRRRVPPPAFP